MKLHISRNYTEIGPFTPAEIKDFLDRGILFESDFVRDESSEDWIPATEFFNPPAPEPAPVVAVEPEPAPVVVAAPAKPAAKPAAKRGKKATA